MPYLSDTADADAAEIAHLYLGSPGVELDEANPENRFGPAWLDATEKLLDEYHDAPFDKRAALDQAACRALTRRARELESRLARRTTVLEAQAHVHPVPPRVVAKAATHGISLTQGSLIAHAPLAYPQLIASALQSGGVVTDSGKAPSCHASGSSGRSRPMRSM